MTMPASTPDRKQYIATAIDKWTRQLVDLTGNNRLIFYRPLKTGTLDLDHLNPSAVDKLFAGHGIRLSALADSGPEGTDVAAALKRVRAITATAQANFEEKGIATLFLTSHLATWDDKGTTLSTPNAPVLLAPLHISPVGAGRTEFTLEITGPWEFNQTLLIFWTQQHGIQFDQLEIDSLAESNQTDHAQAIAGLRQIVGRSGQIHDLHFKPGRYIGNFSYTKLPMVKDLQAAANELAANDLIAAIAGDQEAGLAVSQANKLDGIDVRQPDQVAIDNEHLILDADSSQSFAINAALAGRSLVIEGPPGTGKSQTIANLIAALAAEGRTTLFVAEKRAAIDAVQKRLDQVGLGDLFLDLHQTTLRRRDTAQSLARSLQVLTTTAKPDVRLDQARLGESRSKLVAYWEELHRKRQPWGLSSFDVNVRLASIASAEDQVVLGPATIESLTPERVAELERILGEWSSTWLSIDQRSAWWAVAPSTPNQASELIRLTRHLRHELLPWLIQAGDQLVTNGVGVRPVSIDSLVRLCEVADQIASVDQIFTEEVWSIDPAALAQSLRNRPMGGIGGSYRRVKRQTIALGRNKLHRKQAITHLELAAAAGRAWSGLPAAGRPRRPAISDQLRQYLEAWTERVAHLSPVLPPGPGNQVLTELATTLDRLLATEQHAHMLARLAQLRAVLEQAGLGSLLVKAEQRSMSTPTLLAAFEASWLMGIRRTIDGQQPVLSAFQADEYRRTVDVFVETDRRHRDTGAERVLRRVAERAIHARNQAPEQSAIIEREAGKQRRHRSLRELEQAAGDVLMALRPCWMMSPLMVSQTLPARPMFDCVIFDEASQVRPEEAIASLLRGRQTIVAGDRRQLPPSAFFTSGERDVDEMAEDEETDIDALTSGYESILDVATALLPPKMLAWHYRSEDERLISFSNDHIYGRALTTFPGAHRDTPITFHKVDHRPAVSTEIRSNPTETAQVVDLMVKWARERPDESLGVIAFGQAHATNIWEALLTRLAHERDAGLEAFFDSERPEQVFVKNIERVQGDERDAIILSVGYGKDLNGRVPLRFGPVNQEGGERRLNVAASRARRRMAIVSSITHHDFDPSGLKLGPQLLQALLQFAQSGGSTTGADTSAVPLNAFELMVKAELERLGLRPIAQYGSSSFRIDFALPHPDEPGRMVLAVEADGAAYHSSPTARDRDRLRQQMLERLGWRFHRIWSTAFFANPRAEAEKVRAAYEAALASEQRSMIAVSAGLAPPPPMAPVSPEALTAVPPPTTGPAIGASPMAPSTQPPRTALVAPAHAPPAPPTAAATGSDVGSTDVLGGLHRRPRPFPREYREQIADWHRSELVELVRWLTDDGERLITDRDLKQLLKAELYYQRLGSRIETAFDKAIAAAREKR